MTSLYSSRYCPACCSMSLTESQRRRRQHGDDVRVTCTDCGCTWIRYDRSKHRAYEALAGALVGPKVFDSSHSSQPSTDVAPLQADHQGASLPGDGRPATRMDAAQGSDGFITSGTPWPSHCEGVRGADKAGVCASLPPRQNFSPLEAGSASEPQEIRP